jgi:hypothetical protein
MNSTWMIWFLITAVLVNAGLYGGITLVYFRDKHRPSTGRTEVTSLTVPGAPEERRLTDAA